MSLDISDILVRLASLRDKEFVYQGKALTLDETFSFSGGMPVLVKRANLLCDFLFGESLKVSYQDDHTALMGEKLVVHPEQDTFVLIMLVFDVIEEIFVTAGDAKQVSLS